MANLNKKLGQGKTPQQYKDSSRLAWYGVVGMIIILFLASSNKLNSAGLKNFLLAVSYHTKFVLIFNFFFRNLI